jgi:hypothetical protein
MWKEEERGTGASCSRTKADTCRPVTWDKCFEFRSPLSCGGGGNAGHGQIFKEVVGRVSASKFKR